MLDKQADLKKLHRALVLSDQISEEEFWSGREVRRPCLVRGLGHALIRRA